MFKFNHNEFFIAISHLLDKNLVKSKGDLAQIFDISPSKFSEILNKRMNPSFELYVVLIKNFNFSPEWLLTGKGEMLRNGANGVAEEPAGEPPPPEPPPPPAHQIALLQLQVTALQKELALKDEIIDLLKRKGEVGKKL